jgi:hypothetical protein
MAFLERALTKNRERGLLSTLVAFPITTTAPR